MDPIEIAAIIAIVLIVGGAIFYIVRSKKKGAKCIGCPYAKSCGSKCSCHSADTKKEGNCSCSEKQE